MVAKRYGQGLPVVKIIGGTVNPHKDVTVVWDILGFPSHDYCVTQSSSQSLRASSSKTPSTLFRIDVSG